jgi:hypothetical protein
MYPAAQVVHCVELVAEHCTQFSTSQYPDTMQDPVSVMV